MANKSKTGPGKQQEQREERELKITEEGLLGKSGGVSIHRTSQTLHNYLTLQGHST